MTVGSRVPNQSTSAAIPSLSLGALCCSPLGRTATSSVALATSMPTILCSHIGALSLLPSCLRPDLARYGLRSLLAPATVRVRSRQQRDDLGSSAASNGPGMNGLSRSWRRFSQTILHDFRDTRDHLPSRLAGTPLLYCQAS